MPTGMQQNDSLYNNTQNNYRYCYDFDQSDTYFIE